MKPSPLRHKTFVITFGTFNEAVDFIFIAQQNLLCTHWSPIMVINISWGKTAQHRESGNTYHHVPQSFINRQQIINNWWTEKFSQRLLANSFENFPSEWQVHQKRPQVLSATAQKKLPFEMKANNRKTRNTDFPSDLICCCFCSGNEIKKISKWSLNCVWLYSRQTRDENGWNEAQN